MSISFTAANKSKSNRRIYINSGLSLGLLVSIAFGAVPANAQDNSLSVDQDSLLPPEVVPLDPAAATRMSQSQAQSRAANMASGSQSASSVPGMQPLTPPGGDMQTAQDFRKSMFNSLYNQGTLAPQNAQQGTQNQMANNQQFSTPGNLQQQQPQMGQSQWMGANGAPQTQTLTGAVKQPNRQGNSKFNGVKHALGLTAGLGGGLMVGALMFRNGASGSAAGLGMGLMGASMLNYGMRNAFRGF
jgi:hypothetical protein